MIHYGLQYQKLLRMKNDDIIEAKLALEEAARELKELNAKTSDAVDKYNKCDAKFNNTKEEFDRVLKVSCYFAVEEYFKVNGRYPV